MKKPSICQILSEAFEGPVTKLDLDKFESDKIAESILECAIEASINLPDQIFQFFVCNAPQIDFAFIAVNIEVLKQLGDIGDDKAPNKFDPFFIYKKLYVFIAPEKLTTDFFLVKTRYTEENNYIFEKAGERSRKSNLLRIFDDLWFNRAVNDSGAGENKEALGVSSAPVTSP